MSRMAELEDIVASIGVTLKEVAEAHRETEQAAKRRAEEADQAAKRRAEEADRRAELREEEAKRRAEEAERRLKKLEVLVGNAGRNTGYYAETFFRDALAKTLTFGGIKFDKIIRNMKVEKKESCEFDMVLVNCDTIAIIEAKHRIHPDFVRELATEKLARFRKFFPEYAKYRVYLGVAGFSFDDEVLAEARRLGVGVMRQDGKSVEEDTVGLKAF